MIGFLLALSLGAASVSAQTAAPGPAPAPAPLPVRLDVVVTDARGKPVPSLTPTDFTVLENGRRVAVDSARFVGPAANASSDALPRVFAILLDDYHISPGAQAEQLRESLTRFVRDDLAPGDRIVVLRPLDSLLNIRLAEERDAALQAIAEFSPRRGDYTPRSDFERNFIAGAPARAEVTRARIVTAALRALINELGQFEDARKTLIVVSEGFADAGIRRGEETALPLRSVVAAANRANVAIYSLNPTTAPGPDADSPDRATREAFRALALETGGVNFEASADPRTALLSMRADASGFYVVTFTPPNPDGEVGLEAVSVGVSRRDLTVRTQKAFGRPLRVEPPPPKAASFLSPFSTQLPRRVSPLIRPWFGMSPGAEGKTRVSFVWEAVSRVPGERARALSPSTIALTVTTLDGQPVFSGTVAAVPSSAVGGGGIEPSRVSFEVPAGRFLVQMSIRDLAAQVLDRDVRDIVVGGFPGPVSFGTAEVFRARTAREQQVIAGSATATPIASRQFSRSERLLVRVPVFATEAPVVSAQFVSAFGSVMRELPVAQVPGDASLYQVDLPLNSFAAGVYSVDIQARTAAGSAHERVAIRITP